MSFRQYLLKKEVDVVKQKAFQRYHLIGGLGLAHVLYALGALLLTHRAMILFSFGSIGLAYRTLVISNHSLHHLYHWVKWVFLGFSGLALLHALSVMLETFFPSWGFLISWNENWATIRVFDLVAFFLLFGLNTLEERRFKEVARYVQKERAL